MHHRCRDYRKIDFSERECVVYGKGDKGRKACFDAKTKIHLMNYIEPRTDNNALYSKMIQQMFGGKDKSGNKTLSYHPITGSWNAISTEGEFARARQFTAIYNDELKRLSSVYGEDAKGTVSMDTIQAYYLCIGI